MFINLYQFTDIYYCLLKTILFNDFTNCMKKFYLLNKKSKKILDEILTNELHTLLHNTLDLRFLPKYIRLSIVSNTNYYKQTIHHIHLESIVKLCDIHIVYTLVYDLTLTFRDLYTNYEIIYPLLNKYGISFVWLDFNQVNQCHFYLSFKNINFYRKIQCTLIPYTMEQDKFEDTRNCILTFIKDISNKKE
jgi:hypothetical protein